MIPIIIYHGEKDWVVKPLIGHFGEMDESLTKYVPKFDFVFKNLTKLTENELREMTDKHVYAAMATLSRGHKADFVEKYFVEILGRFPTEAETEDERNCLIALIVYMMELSTQNPEQITMAANKLPTPIKSTIMSTYDILINRGLEQGLEKGREEGALLKSKKVVAQLLKEFPDFSDEKIANLADVTPDFVKKIRAEL